MQFLNILYGFLLGTLFTHKKSDSGELPAGNPWAPLFVAIMIGFVAVFGYVSWGYAPKFTHASLSLMTVLLGNVRPSLVASLQNAIRLDAPSNVMDFAYRALLLYLSAGLALSSAVLYKATTDWVFRKHEPRSIPGKLAEIPLVLAVCALVWGIFAWSMTSLAIASMLTVIGMCTWGVDLFLTKRRPLPPV